MGKKSCGHGVLDAENAVKATLAYYDVVFSSPKIEKLGTMACGEKKITPIKNRINADDVIWLKNHSGCEPLASYQNPHTVQNTDGSIDASYGSVRYRLDQTAYKSCYVIGYDGISYYR